jgi:hypothetical protein
MNGMGRHLSSLQSALWTSRLSGPNLPLASYLEATGTECAISERDSEYRRKYRRHGGRYVDPMVAATARATTIKLVPAEVVHI